MNDVNGLAERMAQRAEVAVAAMLAEPGEKGPPVHPAAAVFPRLSEDELRELAEDIKANGLMHPIALDAEGRIVDGINRDIACDMAGVEKQYIRLPPDTDVVSYILSQNVRRRHMSAGQRAMAVARVRLLETNNQTQQEASNLSGVPRSWIAQAAIIIKYASDLAPGVLAGTEPFDKAYEVARVRKGQQEEQLAEDERRVRRETLDLERLRRVAPDLAALVPASLGVGDALAAFDERERRNRQAREATTALAAQMLSFLDPGVMSEEEAATRIVAMLDAALLPSRPDFSLPRFQRCARTFLAITEEIMRRAGHGEP